MNNSIKHLILNNTLFWCLAIFIIAALFRLTNIDLMEFKYDEAFNVFQLSSLYNQGTFSFHSGISSSGIYNFPLPHYLLAIIGLFSRDPVYLSFVIALINVFLCVYLYLGIKKYYGNLTSVFAALVLASSPWAILYSRKIWNPDLLLLFVIPIFIFLHKLILDKNQKVVFWLFLLLTLSGQQHYSGFALLLTTLVILFFLRIKYSYKSAILGFIVGLIPTLPYFLNGLSPIPEMGQAMTSIFDAASFIRPMQILNGLYFEDALGFDFNLFVESFPILKYLIYIFYLEFIFLILGIFYILRQKRDYIFLLFFGVLIILGYFVTKTPARMYYYIISLPFILIIFALSFKYLFLNFKNKLFKILTVFLALIVIFTNLYFDYAFMSFIQRKQNINGNYGRVFKETKNYLDSQLSVYDKKPDFDKLQVYAYLFPDPSYLHLKLAEYFINSSDLVSAEMELKKSLDFNESDLISRANLILLQLQLQNNNEALLNYKILEEKDSTLSAKLKSYFNK